MSIGLCKKESSAAGYQGLTEKWRRLKRLCFREKETHLEIPVITTRNRASIISNGVNIISYYAFGSTHSR
jgi:hypothetical protein